MTQIWHLNPKEEEGQPESHIKQLAQKRLKGVSSLSYENLLLKNNIKTPIYFSAPSPPH